MKLFNPINIQIVRTAPMAACARVQFDIIAEIQRQRAQLTIWKLEDNIRELQELQTKKYTSRTLKLALERHHRK